MSKNVLSKIPEEIVKFFSLKGNQVLLVKGNAGTGKTIFALECLKKLAKPGCGIYFTTRISPESIYAQHPWIEEFLPPENIVDATRSIFPSKSVVAEILEFSDFPEFLKGTYLRVESVRKIGNPVLVIDSFDAVCSSLKKSVEQAATEFSDFVRKLNVKTILISEYGGKALDYIADGVVEMTSEIFKGRILRKMILRKMRGVEVESPIYYFTLHGGRFVYFSQVDLGKLLVYMLEKPLVFKHGSCPLMSRVMNRLRVITKPPVLLLELDTYHTDEISYIFLTTMVSMFLARRFSGIVVPVREEEVEIFFTSHKIKKGGFLEKFLPIYPEVQAGNVESLHKFITRLKDEIKKSKIKVERIFLIVHYDFMREIFGEQKDLLKILKELIMLNLTKVDISIVLFSSASNDEREELKKFATVVLKIFEDDGVLFVYCEKPYTPVFGVILEKEKNKIELSFTPIT